MRSAFTSFASTTVATLLSRGLSRSNLQEGRSPWQGLGRMLYPAYQNILQHSQHLKPARLRAFQDGAVRNVVNTFWRSNRFYRQLLVEAGVSATAIQGIGDIEQLPTLSKTTLKQAPEWRLYSAGVAMARFWMTSTSGSTGEPFRFPWDARYALASYANTLRVWAWAGVRPDAPSVSCAGERLANLTPHAVYVPPADLGHLGRIAHHAERIRRSGARIIRGYPQTNFEFARVLRAIGAHDIVFSFAFLMGNMLPDGIRDYFRMEFRTNVYDVYGVQEFGIVAAECEFHAGLHINEESLFIEIVDATGRQLAPGARGRIVVTSFQNEIVPFIRYDTGDIGMLIADPCHCGRTLRRIVVEGRNEEMLVRPDGTILSPIQLRHTLDSFARDIRRYRVTQTAPAELLLEIALMESGSRDRVETAVAAVAAHAGPQMWLTTQFVDELALSPSGKFQCFRSDVWRERMDTAFTRGEHP